ncbi:MAG TPA: nicotinate-nucleotide--dimethylbenzimidazole phosphoribosyltransferase [Chitinophagaceae bacterium]|nr:nicotinate-nucleotide--dimethylbenzimidazole phosphoribosyltransferase [Chitinophagaceae bacterium]
MNAAATATLNEALQHKIDFKTKPLRALGKLESIALQAGLIQNTLSPSIHHPHIVVFAADHGIAATGLVNPYPQEVTAQMVMNFLQGGAAINVFCRQHRIALTVVDAGVNFNWNNSITDSSFINAKITFGTKNYLEEPAMTEAETALAIGWGKQIVADIAAAGCNCIGFGEMGIGNTSSASLIMSAVTGIAVEDCVGRGTGVSDEQYAIKITTLQTAFRKHLPAIVKSPSPHTILQHWGGFEIAMMTGAFLQAAALKMIIVVDGFITTAALLLAQLIDKRVTDYCIFGHTSNEKGHKKMLEYLHAEPLLQLDMRLGEGTGAALAMPLVQSAVLFMNEMASFDTAGVSNKE